MALRITRPALRTISRQGAAGRIIWGPRISPVLARAMHTSRPSFDGGYKTPPESQTSNAQSQPPSPSFLASPLGWWKSNSQQVKLLFREYGAFAIVTYLGVYVTTLGSIYGLVELGVIQNVDVNGWLNNWFIKKAIMGDEPVNIPPHMQNLMMAWVMTKLTEPARLVGTLALVPFLVKRLPPSVIAKFRPASGKIADAAKETRDNVRDAIKEMHHRKTH